MTPDNVVVSLQEELIAVKLREAESTLALKELRPKIAELSTQWLKHLQVPSLPLLLISPLRRDTTKIHTRYTI